MQETFIPNDVENEIIREYSHWGTCFFSNSNSKHSRGVVTLINKRLNACIKSTYKDEFGRKLLLNVEINNSNVSLLNLYAPSLLKDRIQYFSKMQKWLCNKLPKQYHVIVDGDMNATGSTIDRIDTSNEPCTKTYKHFKSMSNLHDAWKYIHPNTRDYSYIDPKTSAGISRIDHILTTPSLLSHISTAIIKLAPTPDHKAVIIKFDTNHNRRGKGYWKLNNLLLNDKAYCEHIISIFQNTLDEYNDKIDLHSLLE